MERRPSDQPIGDFPWRGAWLIGCLVAVPLAIVIFQYGRQRDPGLHRRWGLIFSGVLGDGYAWLLVPLFVGTFIVAAGAIAAIRSYLRQHPRTANHGAF